MKWVIIVIIFVFDPLAVLLLLAAQYTFQFRREDLNDDDGERLRLEQQEFERARAQRIVDNPGFTLDDIVPPDVEDTFEPVLEVPKYEDIDQETIDKEFSGEAQLDAYIKEMEQEQRNEEIAQLYIDEINPTLTALETSIGVDLKDIPDTANRMFYQEEIIDQPKKKT